MDKKTLRTKYIKLRKEIKDISLKEEQIINKIINDEKYILSKSIGIYCAYNGEVNLDKLITYSLSVNKTVAIPVIIDEHNMLFYKIESITELNTLNKYGIRETINNNIIDDLSLVIIPGICFDIHNNRIGYGKGYYDNYLRGKTCYKMGVCFDEQIVNDIETDNLDVKLDCVITDKRVLRRF